MSRYKILLVSFYNDEAYGLRILHSILYHYGYDAKMLFIKENNTKLIVQLLKEVKPNIVGFSVVSPNFMLYKALYKEIRPTGDFKILLGGWQPTLQPEECLPYCDVLCRGEGENVIKEIVDDMRNNENKMVYFKPLTPIDYPTPLFDNEFVYSIEDGKIMQQDPYFRNTRYGTMIGRGCPYSCSYCSNSYMKNLYPNWSKIRYRNIEAVLDELREVKRKLPNVKRINFYDEIFMPQKEWAEDFFDRYRKEIGLPFYCMFYPGTCPEKTVKMLKEAGLVGVWIGVQSGSKRVREEVFKRYYTNEALFRQVEVFHKYDISIKYDFIFDNPFESNEEFKETIKLMKQLPRPYLINMFSLKFFPNTEITQMALKQGLIDKTDDQLDMEKPCYLISEEKKQKIFEMVNGYSNI